MNFSNEIALPQIISYLYANGWVKNSIIRDTFQTWLHPSHVDYEVTLPISEGHKRYQSLLIDALEQLSEIEKIDRDIICKKIIMPSYDKIFFRVIADDVNDGKIPFEDGLELYHSAYRLIKEASLKVKSFKDKSKHLSKFKNSLSMGQTQVGSFVISIESPLYRVPSIENMELFSSDSSLGRMINILLFESLRDINNLVEKNSSDEEISNALINQGISKPVCDSLMNIFGDKSHRDFELNIDWSTKEALDKQYFKPIIVHSRNAPKIAHVRNLLESKKEDKSICLSGQIEDLHRSYNDSVGKAKLRTKLRGKDVSVIFSVSEEVYPQIAQAHVKKYSVKISGDVTSFKSSKRIIARFDDVDDIEINSNIELGV